MPLAGCGDRFELDLEIKAVTERARSSFQYSKRSALVAPAAQRVLLAAIGQYQGLGETAYSHCGLECLAEARFDHHLG